MFLLQEWEGQREGVHAQRTVVGDHFVILHDIVVSQTQAPQDWIVDTTNFPHTTKI